MAKLYRCTSCDDTVPFEPNPLTGVDEDSGFVVVCQACRGDMILVEREPGHHTTECDKVIEISCPILKG